ncbi:MAG: redoxin domain-containing protein [Isosphaeraceae bacterium]|nr:redoxin domain-containing protein [Isosphaeraceae bacterium]
MHPLILTTLLLGFGAEATRSAEPHTITAFDGSKVVLEAPRGGVLALVYYSSECPISNELSPLVNDVASAFPRDRVRLVGIAVDYDRSIDELRDHARDHGYRHPCTLDRDGSLCRAFGASMTPEGVVIDDKGVVRYRGRLNDLYSARGKRNANPSTHEFRDAVAAVLEGKEVPKPWPPAVGCPLPEFPETSKPETEPGVRRALDPARTAR